MKTYILIHSLRLSHLYLEKIAIFMRVKKKKRRETIRTVNWCRSWEMKRMIGGRCGKLAIFRQDINMVRLGMHTRKEVCDVKKRKNSKIPSHCMNQSRRWEWKAPDTTVKFWEVDGNANWRFNVLNAILLCNRRTTTIDSRFIFFFSSSSFFFTKPRVKLWLSSVFSCCCFRRVYLWGRVVFKPIIELGSR